MQILSSKNQKTVGDTFGSWSSSLSTDWSLESCRYNLLREVEVLPEILDTWGEREREREEVKERRGGDS